MRAKKPDSDQPNEISAPNPEGTKPKKGPSKAPKKQIENERDYRSGLGQ